jgi:outer membrane protein W
MKTAMIVIAIILVNYSVKAQNLSFGPTGGFGHSWTNSDKGSLDRKFHASYNLGGKFVYSFMSHWGVSGDLKFSSEGQTLGVDQNNKSVTRLNYIRIPLQGIYFFGNYGERIRPKVSLGPSLGFLVGGKSKVYDNGTVNNEVKSKDFANSFDFGLTGAAGANIRINTATWLNLDLAYYHGLTDLSDASTAKNRNLGINIGVTFPLGTVKPEELK